MSELKFLMVLFIVCLKASMVVGQNNNDLPSESRIHKDLNIFFRKYYSKQFLDPKVYQTKDLEMVSFDYESEDTLRPDQISIQKFPGYFMDTLSRECLALIFPANSYPTGPIWGIPYAMLFVYKYQNNKWALKYVENFYGRLELISFNKNNKLNQIHVNIDYCNQGLCQWLTVIAHFQNYKLNTLFYDNSYNDLMSLASRIEAKDEYLTNPLRGDTLGKEVHLDDIKDLNGDNINEIVMKEEITLFNTVRKDGLYYETLTRRKVYQYINGKLKLTEAFPYIKEELSYQFSNE
ncbi:MAG: hypothetical protein J7604_06150 [Sporocytophaga sp.]|uniref:hypothetical protein n=1 Tax=Sporocytophaga sp. TaxID=2231183 RepID=UPI001AFF86BE|nr:hypothetical protein [Sporocytophaga sp.]MBO9699773.1 hypothetical protein [Sporocytophaga sp.]